MRDFVYTHVYDEEDGGLAKKAIDSHTTTCISERRVLLLILVLGGRVWLYDDRGPCEALHVTECSFSRR
jgi:hypothetical protein